MRPFCGAAVSTMIVFAVLFLFWWVDQSGENLGEHPQQAVALQVESGAVQMEFLGQTATVRTGWLNDVVGELERHSWLLPAWVRGIWYVVEVVAHY